MHQANGSTQRTPARADALLPPGPLVLEVEEVRQLWSFVHGDVMDPGIRDALRESLGLCARHTWGYAVVEIELWQTGGGVRAGHQPFDVSVLYEDLLAHVAAGLSRPRTLLHPHPESILRPRRPCYICAQLAPADVGGPRVGYASSNSAALTDEANAAQHTRRWCAETAGQWRTRVCPDCRVRPGATAGFIPDADAVLLLCRAHLLGRGRTDDALLAAVAQRLDEVRTRLGRLNASMTVDGAPATAADDASWIEALGFFAGWALPLHLAGERAGQSRPTERTVS